MSGPELIQTASNALVGMAAVVVAVAAVLALVAGRKVLRGMRRVELAEEVLGLVYEARDAIREIRNPLGDLDEARARKPSPTETPQESRLLQQAYIVQARYRNHVGVFDKLHAMRFRFAALFGAAGLEPFDALRSQQSHIILAIHVLTSTWLGRLYGRQGEEIDAQARKYEAVIWEGVDEDDEMSLEVDRIVASMEALCRPLIERDIGWFTRLPDPDSPRRPGRHA